MDDERVPKLTIGLYVYNGEKYLRERLENILSQSYTNFELIISNNASFDSTHEICNDFSQKDGRIKYFQQKHTVNIQENGNFVLNKAQTEFFVWTQVDDIWELEFLKETIQILEKNPNLVGCNSQVDIVGSITDYLKDSENDTFFKKYYKKIRKKFRKMNTESLKGDYDKRLRTFLKNPGHNNILFGVFKTKEFQNSTISEMFVGNDFCIVLNLLKYGEIHVINKICMYQPLRLKSTVLHHKI